MNVLTPVIEYKWDNSSYKKRVLAHFENNLDFKATREFYLENQGGF